MLESRQALAIACPGCGTQVASHFLVCPGCHRLVHAETLKRLADEAGSAEAAGQWATALAAWRSALELLPTGSKQHATISAKVSDLGKKVDASPSPKPAPGGSKPGWAGGAAGLGTFALMLLSKGKILLLGLTKASTLFSMFVTVGAYWTLWGWPFAIGLVLTTYIHEMGHVAALLRYGIKADAPMFIPGIGAVIRARQRLANPREEAQVGLAGPLWGLGSVAACYGAYLATDQLMFAAIAKLAAIINLFNLIPIWQLDGGHAFRAFSRTHRWLAAVVASVFWATMPETEGFLYFLLFALMVCAVARAAFDKPSEQPDLFSALEYAGLVVALGLAAQIPAPLP
jgi:Zn-dependent protease